MKKKNPEHTPDVEEEKVEEVAESECAPEEEKSESEILNAALLEEKQNYLRTLAEMENLRKRMQKEKADVTRFAVENVVSEFLAPLDNLENALGFTSQASEETKNWAMGFQMILTQFKDVLVGHNITSFHSEGEEYNPHLHEALEMEETEKHKPGTIIQEFMKGYKCGDRVLRPAKVKVAKEPSKQVEEEKLQEEENN